MLWKLLQLIVFIAVMFTGIYYEWTPNGFVLSLVAATCSFAVTVLLGDLFRFLSWLRLKLRSLRGQKRPQYIDPRRRHIR